MILPFKLFYAALSIVYLDIFIACITRLKSPEMKITTMKTYLEMYYFLLELLSGRQRSVIEDLKWCVTSAALVIKAQQRL